MKREVKNQNEQLGRAVSEAFNERPDCGALGSVDEVSRRRIINELIGAAAQMDVPILDQMEANKKRIRRFIFIAAAGFVIVVLASVFLGRSDKTNDLVQDTYFGKVQACDNTLLIGEKRVLPNAQVPVGKSIRTQTGNAMLQLPTGIDWWMNAHAEAEISTLDENTIEATVHSGEVWFRVDPMRKGPGFSVDTLLGRIDVKGTIFVVNVQPTDTQITLLRGEIWVTQLTGQKKRISSGNSIRLSQGEAQMALTADESGQYHEQLVALAWDDGADEDNQMASNGRVDRSIATNDSGENVVISSVEKEMSKPATYPASYNDLIDEIYVQRKKSNWKSVELLYKRLFKIAPGSETALISYVALGEIYLTKLHKYNEALAQFDKYLRSGHTALLPEAVYGKCNAYKLLGKKDEEQKCLSDFIQQFRGAFQVSQAKVRLSELRAE